MGWLTNSKLEFKPAELSCLFGFNIDLGSTHVVEQLSFSLFLSILTLDFDSILGSFLTFWGPNGLLWGLGTGQNTVLGTTHVVEQLYFSMLP